VSSTARAGSVDVEVLIPHWNRASMLRETLASLRNQTLEAPVCVIDNGSTDDTEEMLTLEFPGVRRLALGENRGFGRALNAAAESSSANLLVFLNNDAVADEHFIEELVSVHEKTAAETVAGFLLRPDGTVDTSGVEVDQSLIVYDHLHGEPYPPREPPSLSAPLAPSGGAGAFQRSAFLDVGGFDEGFFAYLEDVDLGIRMRVAGMRCAIAPGAFAWHRHAGTLGAGSAAKNRLLGFGRGRLLWKHGANLGVVPRLRGLAVDSVAYCGQALVDRNLGAVRGRLESRAAVRGVARPAANPGFASLPIRRISLLDAIGRRWERGRRYRAGRAAPVR
jgi:GT2 family glycosyltransferase